MVGPKGRCSISAQTWPTITGLMKSGTIRIDMMSPRPRKSRTMLSARTRPSTNSMATLAPERMAVTASDQRATGSLTTRSKFFRPTKAWPGTWKS